MRRCAVRAGSIVKSWSAFQIRPVGGKSWPSTHAACRLGKRSISTNWRARHTDLSAPIWPHWRGRLRSKPSGASCRRSIWKKVPSHPTCSHPSKSRARTLWKPSSASSRLRCARSWSRCRRCAGKMSADWTMPSANCARASSFRCATPTRFAVSASVRQRAFCSMARPVPARHCWPRQPRGKAKRISLRPKVRTS